MGYRLFRIRQQPLRMRPHRHRTAQNHSASAAWDDLRRAHSSVRGSMVTARTPARFRPTAFPSIAAPTFWCPEVGRDCVSSVRNACGPIRASSGHSLKFWQDRQLCQFNVNGIQWLPVRGMNMAQPNVQQFKATMADNGRVVIPSALRARLGVAGQRADIFFLVQGEEVTLTTRLRELRRAQDRLAKIARAGSKRLSDELIEDRRAEARSESGDA